MSRPQLYVFALLTALIQGYFFSSFSQVLIPNLTLILVVYMSRSVTKVAWPLAAWSGFWLDVASQVNFGLRMMFFLAAAVCLDWLRKTGLDVDGRFPLAAIVFGGSLVYNLVIFGAGLVDVGAWFSLFPFIPRWIFEASISALFAFMAHDWLSSRVNTKSAGIATPRI